MTIRQKTMLLTSAVMFALVLVVMAVCLALFARQNRIAEQDIGIQKTVGVLFALGREAQGLHRVALDYAHWDDVCLFIEDRQPAFVETHLGPSTFSINKLSAMAILDTTGQILWSASPGKREAPEGFLHAVSGNLFRRAMDDGESGGLFAIGGRTVALAAARVHDSASGGPARGVLAVWRELPLAEVEKLLQATVRVLPLEAVEVGHEEMHRLRAADGDEGIVVALRPEGRMVARTLMGAPPGEMLLEVTARQVYADVFRKNILVFCGILLFLGACASGVFAFSLNPLILRRIARLNHFVQGVEGDENLRQRLETDGDDELARLASALNQMLARMEAANELRRETERALRHSETRYRMFLANFLGIAYQTGQGDDSPLLFEGSVEAITGYTEEDFTSGKISWDQIVVAEDLPGLLEDMERLETIPDFIADNIYRIRKKNGDTRWVHDVCGYVLDESGTPALLQGAIFDVTQREQAKHALAEGAELLRKVSAHIPGMVYQLRQWPDGHRTMPFASEGIARLYGLRAEDVFEGIAPLLCMIHPEDAEEYTASVETSAHNLTPWMQSFRARVPGQPVRWHLGHSVPERLPDGSVLWHGFVSDITERRKEEEQMIIQAKALGAAANGIVITDSKGEIIWVNDAFCRMSGYSEAEAVGSKTSILKSGAHDTKFYDEMWAAIRAGKVWEGEVVNRRKDGTTYAEEITITPVVSQSGIISHFIAIKQDVTERKLSATELALRESLLKGLAEASLRLLSGFATGDQGMHAAFRLLGEAADVDRVYLFENSEDMISTSMRFEWCKDGIEPTIQRTAMHSIPLSAISSWRDRLLEGDFVSGHLDEFPEAERRVLEGQNIQSLLLAPIHLDGRFFGILGFDVCRKKREWRDSERQILGAAAYMFGLAYIRQKAEERRKELETNLRQAQKLETVGTMAGGIAHDFNNLLLGISGFTELALTECDPDSQTVHHLRRVLQATLRAKDLVAKMLLFSRRGEPDRRPVLLHSIVEESLALVRAATPATIDIRTDLRCPDGVVVGDPGQLQQVLLNLCTNAAHAMREGGGTLKISLAKTRIDEHGSTLAKKIKPGRYLALTVSDTGAGIPQDHLDKIFDPFFTTKQKGEGSGLGLSIVHGIARDHDAVVTVESEPEKGTTFCLWFPLSDLPVAPAPEEDVPHSFSRDGSPEARVLLLDDEPVVLELGKKLLQSTGYKVTAFGDPRAALECFRRAPGDFDLLITDQTMPEMTGMEVARDIVKIRPGFPVILLSGFSTEINTKNMGRSGVSAFLKKPFRIRDLTRLAKQLLATPLSPGDGPEG